MRKILLFAVAAGLLATSASAQLPGLRKRDGPPQPILVGIDALRADFMAKTGTDTVYFGGGTAILGAPTLPTLRAQALWVLQHPEVVVRIEGHGDPNDTRDHALALGARRAEAVRNYLVLLGVPALQVSTTSWGKERPGAPRAVTVLVR
jgi:peptidoglycan-associated lipoprotein